MQLWTFLNNVDRNCKKQYKTYKLGMKQQQQHTTWSLILKFLEREINFDIHHHEPLATNHSSRNPLIFIFLFFDKKIVTLLRR